MNETLGPLEVLQPEFAEVTQLETVTQRILRELACGPRQEHLAAVGRRRDPGRPVHVDADVVVAAQRALPRVQAHPNPHGAHLRGPRLGGQGTLDGGGGRHRGGRTLENHEEGVALGRDLDAAGGVERGSKQRVVTLKERRERVAELLDEARRPFDVREEEGQRSGGKVSPSRSV